MTRTFRLAIAIPILVLLEFAIGRQDEVEGIYLWTVAGASVGFAALLLTPVIAGLSCWWAMTAGRSRLIPLMESTERGRTGNDMNVTVVVASGVGLALLGYICIRVFQGLMHSSFHIVDWPPVLLSVFIATAAVSIGCAAGVWSTATWSPFAVAATTAAFVLGLPILASSSSVRYVAGYDLFGPRSGGILQTYWPAVWLPFMLWTLGLSALGIAFILLRGRSMRSLGLVVLAIAVVVTGSGAAALGSLPSDQDDIARTRISFTPVCRVDLDLPIEVCVHPAYEPILDETLNAAAVVFGPVLGLAGVPSQIDQLPTLFTDASSAGEVLPVYFPSNGMLSLVDSYGMAAVNDIVSEGQLVVFLWLIRPYVTIDLALIEQYAGRLISGGSDGRSPGISPAESLFDALVRFDQLDDQTRRTWLEQNWASLRSGDIDLQRMP